MASGYFAVWLAAGAGVYMLGIAFAAVTMQSELFSHVVPLLSSALSIAAGLLQFTRWKMTHLLRCRSPFGCTVSSPQPESSFRLGCKQGTACCVCCATLMTMQLAIGIMNPLAMMVVASAIAAEKLLPWPAIVARIVGVSAVLAGAVSSCMFFIRQT
jgi:predicted metal-binding membrane protein